jgi:Uma2 family endonuclease
MGALPALKEEQIYTYAEYKDWDLKVGERYELIYGEPYAMAGPNTNHQAILGAIFTRISNYLEGKPCKVFPAPYDVRLFYEDDESDDTVVQPDIMVICDKNKIGPEGCRGAPDLVIEILSPSNTAIEMERKFTLYRDVGIREYWIVDPVNNSIKVHRFQGELIITNTYGATGAIPVSIFPDFSIALNQVFAEL